MKRIFLLCSLFGLYSSIVFAQTSDSLHRTSGYISINYGYGMPIGAFASHKDSTYKGYALYGSVLTINATLPVEYSHWGIALRYNRYKNKFDDATYTCNYPKGTGWFVTAEGQETEYYSENGFSLSAMYTCSIKDFSIDCEIGGTILECSLPDALVQIAIYDTSSHPRVGSGYAGTNASTCHSISFNASTNFRYALINHKIGLNFWIGFLYANPRYTTTEKLPPTPSNYFGSTVTAQGNMPILLLSFEAGIFYQFGK